MQIEINGKRNITLDFNAPKKFRLVKDGAEIPYIRTGKNSFRLTKPVEGFVELEEIVEQPRYMQPVQLQPQQMTVINPQDVDRLNEAVRQMALVNPQDVMIINQTAEQLEKNQNFIAQTQKEITDNQVYIDQQQQRLNETALGIQALETNNSQRLDGAENAILNLAGEISNAQNMAVDGMNTALNKIEEQGILLQAEIDKKADKDELEILRKDFEEKSDQFSNAMSNYSGGTAYDTLPQGGEAGQILAKRTDRQGDYIWIDQTPVIVKSETMPTASEKYKGEVYQYVGETGDYTHGYIYECQEIENNFVWVRLDVQPNTAVWGQITGTLSNQTDLQNALDNKQDKLTQTQMDAVNSGANQSNIAQITTNQSNINTINSKIPSSASSSNQLADKSYVDTADNGLQSQIDAIVASSDVFDIVGTYAELQAYDISTVPVNDIVKVLVDSTHSGAATYYRCIETAGVKSWSYIGSEGAYYTKGEADSKFSTITATGNSLDYTGNTLSLENSSGTVLSSVTINSTPDLDNKSITLNGSSQLQTVGVINQNDTTTAVKTWTGTKTQYNNIQSKDANTQYMITDTGEIYLGSTLLSNYGADTSLSNLTSTGKNIANWSNNVTNCITEIPQDIKVSVSGTVATLAAGSKVWYPNGSGIFDSYTLESDVTFNYSDPTKRLVFLDIETGRYVSSAGVTVCYSGATQPSGTAGRRFWYDTTNNVIKSAENGSSTFSGKFSFPLWIQYGDGSTSSIDQVFNGFSHIGGTLIAFPGVKGLIPNGRNADGSLKNIDMNITSVQTRTFGGTTTLELALGSSGYPSHINIVYDEEKNVNIHIPDGDIRNVCNAGTFSFTNGIITSLTPKTAFHALDYNDSPTISGWSMPDIDSMIAVTAGSASNQNVAAMSGYILYSSTSINQDRVLYINNVPVSYFYNAQACVMTPIAKGDSWYFVGEYNTLYFIPCKGEI